MTGAHHVHRHSGDAVERRVGLLQSPPRGQAPAHDVVMHHQQPQIAGRAGGEFARGPVELRAGQATLHPPVARIPRDRLRQHPRRGVEPHQRHAGQAHHRLEHGIDVRPVALVQPTGVAPAEGRMPPGRIVVAWHFEGRRHGAELIKNRSGAYELVLARPLGKIPGDHDGVEA